MSFSLEKGQTDIIDLSGNGKGVALNTHDAFLAHLAATLAVAPIPNTFPNENNSSDQGINAALAIAGRAQLEFGKVYHLRSPIVMPSYAILFLNGAELKAMTPFVNAAAGLNGLIVSASGTIRPTVVGPGIVNGNRVGLGGSRLNLFRMSATKGFTVGGLGRILGMHSSGYGCWAESPTFAKDCSGKFIGIDLENCEIHYEATGVKGVMFEDITSGDMTDGGVAIACASYMHALGGSEDVTFKHFRGRGAVASVVEQSNNVAQQKNIRYLDAIGSSTNGGIGFVMNGTFGSLDTELDHCDFGSDTYIGANIIATGVNTGRMSNTKIRGIQQTLVIDGAGHDWELENTKVLGTATGGANAFGLQAFSGAKVRVDGASTLSAIAPAGGIPFTGSNIVLDPNTKILPRGGGDQKRTTHPDDQTQNVAIPYTLHNNSVPVIFDCNANKSYELEYEGSIAADATVGYEFSLLGGGGIAFVTFNGSIMAGTSGSAVAFKGLTALTDVLNVVPAASAFLPFRIRLSVNVGNSGGTIEFQVKRTGPSGLVYLRGGGVSKKLEI